MFASLPASAHEFMTWPWAQIEPYYQDLYERPIDAGRVSAWLVDWTRLSDLLSERYSRLSVAISQDTKDSEAEAAYNGFLDEIFPNLQAWEQKLKEKLMASGLEPGGLDQPLRKMRAEAALFRTENLPLLTQERKLASQYNRLAGGWAVEWEGEERTLLAMRPIMQASDREQRERIWHLMAGRQLADRGALNDLWVQFMHLRGLLAANAGLPSYLAYRWQQMLRLDYTPEDALTFQNAIEQVAVPAATRVYARYREKLGIPSVRPWDLDLDLYTINSPPLPSYGSVESLAEKASAVFHGVDARLGDYFDTMRAEELLDLENRKGKAPGGYCTSFPVAQRPFIFMNAVGLSEDVRTILHEAGHAFHNFERYSLPYAQQRGTGLEFAEVASMSMELLTAPYMGLERGGFYSQADADRALAEQLERVLIFWPYMGVVDSFQHWVYSNHEAATQPERCDEKWLELWNRYLPGVDWSGLEEEAKTGWHRKLHIFQYPFYYIEYGLAQLGSVQVWGNALQDQAAAVERYRQALRLGGTVTLPDLYEAAGARLAFDPDTLGQAVALVEGKLAELEASARQA